MNLLGQGGFLGVSLPDLPTSFRVQYGVLIVIF